MDFSKFQCIDFGCSIGGNIEFIKKALPGINVLGIDIDPNKIKVARDRGNEAIIFDILTIEGCKSVDFVTMSHFLEHLDSPRHAEKFIKKAVDISRSFVHIRQPFFDGDYHLLEWGLKLYWADWSGHPNNMKVLDFYKIGTRLLNSGLIHSFSIYGRTKITDSKNECIVPLGAPNNSGKYEQKFGVKKMIFFNFPLFKETVMEIKISNSDISENLERLRARIIAKGEMHLIFNSDYKP